MKVVPAWENRSFDNHDLNARVNYATKAKEKGMWIYDHSSKILYSPDEFVWDKKLTIANTKRGGDFSRFELIDVRSIISNKREAIAKLLNEIDVLEKRIWQFYKLVPKK